MCHGQMLGDALLRARKPHRCSECRKEISPGKWYRRYAWKDGMGDAPSTVKLCERCNAILNTREGDNGEACYYLGEARGDIRGNTIGGGWWRELRAKVRKAMLDSRKNYGKA